MEDIVKIKTGVGKTICGFILKKFLEGKFGIKFADFQVDKLYFERPADLEFTYFEICIHGKVITDDVVKLMTQKEKTNENN